jgi:hypothetical protein
LEALKEFMRVCKGTIRVQVPHWLGRNARRDPSHRNFEVMHAGWWIQHFRNAKVWSEYSRFIIFARPEKLNVVISCED